MNWVLVAETVAAVCIAVLFLAAADITAFVITRGFR